jgi:hypothetical protein
VKVAEMPMGPTSSEASKGPQEQAAEVRQPWCGGEYSEGERA